MRPLAPPPPPAPLVPPPGGTGGARRAFDEARAHEAAGRLDEARGAYAAAAEAAVGEPALLAEVLLRAARAHYRAGDAAAAEASLRCSLGAADDAGDDARAAEALSGIGKFAIDRGALDEACAA